LRIFVSCSTFDVMEATVSNWLSDVDKAEFLELHSSVFNFGIGSWRVFGDCWSTYWINNSAND
jgi:hypothetical protein